MDSSKEDHLASLRRRNKAMIITLFFLIFSLALIIGGIIISFVLEYNFSSQSPKLNPAVMEFCSVSESQLNCTASLSSSIKTTLFTDPTRVYVLSLKSAAHKLLYIESVTSRSHSNDSQIDSSFQNCWSSLRVAMRGLDAALAVMRVNPDIETQTFEMRRSMVLQIEKAMEVLRPCVRDLEKMGAVKEGSESTLVDEAGERVHEVEVLLRNSRYFLRNFDWVNGNFRANANWSRTIVENLAAVILFGSQYLVLIFLFFLLLKKN